jgi:hypothetical protein
MSLSLEDGKKALRKAGPASIRVESLDAAIALGGQRERLLSAYTIWVTFYGYPDVISKELHEFILEKLDDGLSSGENLLEMEVRTIRKDGSVVSYPEIKSCTYGEGCGHAYNGSCFFGHKVIELCPDLEYLIELLDHFTTLPQMKQAQSLDKWPIF